MERAAEWGVTVDLSREPVTVSATYRGVTTTVPATPDFPEAGRASAVWLALQGGAFHRPGRPSRIESLRRNVGRLIAKERQYARQIAEIDAQIASYPNPADAPQDLRDQRAGLAAKSGRFPAYRAEAEAELKAAS